MDHWNGKVPPDIKPNLPKDSPPETTKEATEERIVIYGIQKENGNINLKVRLPGSKQITLENVNTIKEKYPLELIEFFEKNVAQNTF